MADKEDNHEVGVDSPRVHIPTEAETPPEHLSSKQTVNMIRLVLKDTMNMTESISSEEDGMIRIADEFKLWKINNHWNCHYRNGSEWSPCYPLRAKSPMDFFPRIVQHFARKKLAEWLMTNYFCMA
jgi:hypothetical protein